MECLFPVSGPGSIVYSLMTDTHGMEGGSPCPHLQPPGSRRWGASANEAGPETRWTRLSCEPWPPSRERRGPLKKKTAGFWFQTLTLPSLDTHLSAHRGQHVGNSCVQSGQREKGMAGFQTTKLPGASGSASHSQKELIW